MVYEITEWPTICGPFGTPCLSQVNYSLYASLRETIQDTCQITPVQGFIWWFCGKIHSRIILGSKEAEMVGGPTHSAYKESSHFVTGYYLWWLLANQLLSGDGPPNARNDQPCWWP